ncbi:hypothetical protein GCM10023205_78100 [Yinghuangia aomiensis]|uniref:Helix-turn-helix domain-containing protein n=1 Tax=Yinghuangia aomiensis TaxID=676205 RepID=A0ABP9IB65_9ACTN
MRNSISFGPGVEWGGISQAHCQLMAKDPRHDLTYRVYFAALSRANQIGHAPFGMRELARILVDGDGVIPSASSVRNAIARAKDRGLIEDRSTARCLVLSGHHFQKGGRGPGRCVEHDEAPAAFDAA